MENTLLLGDCFKHFPNIPNASVDLIVVDPPYLTTSQKWDKTEVVTPQLSSELFRIAKPTCSLYLWCGMGEKSQSLMRWFPIFQEEWHFKDIITWKKQRGIGARKGWLYTREECLWFVKDNKQFVWNTEHQYSTEKRVYTPNPEACKSEYKRLTNVWSDINESSLQGSCGQVEVKGHFTPKPTKAIERIIQAHTKEGDVVFDCFAGSGTTLVAAQNLNRRYIGIEKDPTYYKLIEKRLKESKIQNFETIATQM